MTDTQAIGWLKPDFIRLKTWFAPSVALGVAAAAVVYSDTTVNDTRAHLFGAFAAAWFAGAAASLFAQSVGWRPTAGLAFQIAVAAAAAAVVWFDKQIGLFAPLLYAGLAVACLAAPLRAFRDAESYWVWCEKVALAALLAGAAALIGFVAAVATFWSADKLFGIGDWPRRHYASYAAATFFCIIAPSAFLAILPPLAPGALDAGARDFIRRALAILVSWALVPFVLIYSALLWLYAAKIGFERMLPHGQIGWMVGLFGFTALATVFLAYPQRTSGSAHVRLFWRIWPWLAVAPLILLGFALFERLDAYGLTAQRYVAVLLAALCASNVAVALMGRDRVVRFAPAAAALTFLAASFGPWGAIGASTRWQAQTVRSILAEHGLIRDGVVIEGGPRAPLTARQSSRWSGALSYLASQQALDLVLPDPDGRAQQKLAALVQTGDKPPPAGYRAYNAAGIWTAPTELDAYRLIGTAILSEPFPKTLSLGAATIEATSTAFTVRLGQGEPATFDYEKIAARLADGGKLKDAPLLRPSGGDGRIVLLVENLSMNDRPNGSFRLTWLRAHVLARGDR